MIATLTAMLASALPWLVLGVGGLAAIFGYRAKVRSDATKAEKQRVAVAAAVQDTKDTIAHQQMDKRMATAPDLKLANELRRNIVGHPTCRGIQPIEVSELEIAFVFPGKPDGMSVTDWGAMKIPERKPDGIDLETWIELRSTFRSIVGHNAWLRENCSGQAG